MQQRMKPEILVIGHHRRRTHKKLGAQTSLICCFSSMRCTPHVYMRVTAPPISSSKTRGWPVGLSCGGRSAMSLFDAFKPSEGSRSAPCKFHESSSKIPSGLL
jgi:hypothetical protein